MCLCSLLSQSKISHIVYFKKECVCACARVSVAIKGIGSSFHSVYSSDQAQAGLSGRSLCLKRYHFPKSRTGFFVLFCTGVLGEWTWDLYMLSKHFIRLPIMQSLC